MKVPNVILVNENDEETGQLEKMEAHRKGILHRAFSVFIFDLEGRLLIHQRAAEKYHGGLLWTNTCCSHPYPGEDTATAARRRLREEMGFEVELEKLFAFIYRAEVENGLVEHEYDHVFAGNYEGVIHADPSEVADYKYVHMSELKTLLQTKPESFTTWFRIAFPRIETWWRLKYR